MAKFYRIPDFKKMYPEASEDIIAVLKTTERKMQYQEYDIKVAQTVMAQDGQTVITVPSREDSYERLLEQNVQFSEETVSIEDLVIRNIQSEQLQKVLALLSKDEQNLIDQLYFLQRTEREIAKEMALSQNSINKRRHKVLKKLRALLEKV